MAIKLLPLILISVALSATAVAEVQVKEISPLLLKKVLQDSPEVIDTIELFKNDLSAQGLEFKIVSINQKLAINSGLENELQGSCTVKGSVGGIEIEATAPTCKEAFDNLMDLVDELK
ncbi:hypothetical protein PULV_a2160 [Pseudoalteromonas ulvae UL12]|uniref:hypothetical protein n=1 Tax=Pseudoalteromonas ulvae TaxID=107327 RepID=UPI00186B75C2|nr:hypothetical protein [Pseudoalteromonas ulvae]MBE0365377.1 hypothetical protein [Pseudoalteromonas ulvae UL12]